MEIIGYCTVDSYRIKSLLDKYQATKNVIVAEMMRDTLHLVFHPDKEAFIFPYGVIVTWGMNRQEGLILIEEIAPFEKERVAAIETDEFVARFGDISKVASDVITLTKMDTLTKMAVSHGIAQSVELSYFETAIQRSFESTRKIPGDLVKYGKIPLSRKEIRKKMAEIFQERSSINLHADVLDLPEFFWEHPELEPTYQMVANYLDIRARVEVLNHRLDIMHELYGVLGSELNHQHSTRLEMTIVLLIVVEVFLTLLRDVFHLL